MTEQDLSPNIDIAAKARASVIEEGEAGFDMEVWYKSNCETTACLAGHIALVGGVEYTRREPELRTRSHDVVGRGTWRRSAICKLLGVSLEEYLTNYWGGIKQELKEIFLHTGSSREAIIEEFDALVQKWTTDEEFQSYLQKSYGYQGYYRRIHEQNAKDDDDV